MAQQDSIPIIKNDTSLTINDSVKKADTLNSPYKISPSAIKSNVDYTSNDSIRLDVKSQKVYMYKNNDISYELINLKADYIEIEFGKNEIYATHTEDSLGNPVGRPIFTIDNSSFESASIRYNYETEKGLVKKVITEDAEGYLHGSTVKKMPNDITYVSDGAYTTCELEHPHFEFRFKKAKVIPENKIITGPANLVIEDVPTPLAIPFGLFPNKKGQRSGIVIPTWGESAQRGFYFENGGYFAAINEYLTFQLLGDIYTLGSWSVKPTFKYNKKYRFNGGLSGNYNYNITGEQGTPEYLRRKDFSIRWVHNQDAKAHPSRKFSANVNIMSSENNKFTGNSNNYLSNTFQSSINYSKNWAGKYNLNVALKHQQNNITKEINLSLPSLSFSVNRFYPLRAKKMVGKLKWYENISVNYNVVADNQINTLDSLLFTGDVVSKMKNGLKHDVSVSSGSIKIMKYIVWSNSVKYTERWYTQRHEKFWRNDTLFSSDDPPTLGYVDTDTIYGFNTVRDFSFNTSFSTTMYGMYAYKAGPITAIRHVIKPSINFSIRPDFSKQEWGYYQYYTDENGKTKQYSMYDNFIYGTAPQGRSGFIGFKLSNSLEMKVRSRKDTITGTKKVVLIEDFSLSTGYDIARDSLNLNTLNLTGRTKLFKQLQINYSSSFDPYALDSAGHRINKFEWDVNKRFYHIDKYNWRLGVSYRLSSDILKKDKKGDKKAEEKPPDTEQSGNWTDQELKDVNENRDSYVDWNVPWSLNLSYDLNYTNNFSYTNGYWNYTVEKEKKLIQTLGFNGDVNITPKWKFGFRSGYDFENKKLTYTSLDIYRDLHCWEMRFSWIPIGFRQSWNFSINIKSSLLQDLKLNKKKDFRDF
ncbi:MAG: LPS-assembly protein LptD [Bacteroidales bacterium]|nr:LPS-assembly protein LptD [Bacteroidales bacterium]